MCVPRSGSSYVFRRMSQSPDIQHTYYEPFLLEEVDKSVEKNFYAACWDVMNDITRHPTGVLIKDTLNYIDYIDNNSDSDCDFKTLFSRFYTHINNNFYKIKLFRRNIFEQAVSNCIAEITDKWSTFHDEFRFPLVTVEIEHLKKVLDRHKHVRNFLLSYPCYDEILYYEDIIDSTTTNDWGFNFLKKPEIISDGITVKNPLKNRIVINYQDLVEWYNKHKHQYEINDDK